ncbi:hypothetical protein XENOCAPTIV_021238 [Xenoophorus captivus]|uniref:Protein kinase domain-containing protein n=1 Tax=Xenoophorus captivus TaxID=1517983 RepID=A0ABV0RLB8_9TELE
MWLVQHCARDILEALSFLHREGYVHADLKPRNILWSADDECFKLIDFGLSFKQGNQVFVEYANSSDSKEAQRLLTGRTFDGRFVVATFYPLSAYKRGYLYQTVQ